MRKLLILLIGLPLFAGVNPGGFIEYYARYWANKDSARWTLNRLTFKLNMEGDLNEHLHLKVECYLTSNGFPQVNELGDLTARTDVSPVSYRLGEAYADIYGFLLPNLDLRIGKQEINWGTADKINPTSNLNPYDMDDFLNFGDKLPVNALRAFYSTSSVNLELAFVPLFTPSYLPSNEFTTTFFNQISLPQNIPINSMDYYLVKPAPKIKESSSFAIKASGTVFDWDVSCSYYHGRLTFPVPDSLIMIPDSLKYDVNAFLGFPKIDVIGADFSGSLAGIGLWGEFAYFIPEKTILETKLNSMTVSEDTVLENPYLKFVLGSDYTFSNGIYVNLQFIHGFINENGDSLNDYITFRVEKKFLNDRLKIAPMGIAAEIPDWSDIKSNYGYILNPEVTYSPFDNVEFKVGGIVIDGKGTNAFARLKEVDETYLKLKVSF